MSEQDGVYGATAIATVLLVDKKIDALLGDSALVEIRTETSFANGDTAEVSGTTRLVYIDSRTPTTSPTAMVTTMTGEYLFSTNLNGDSDAWGDMHIHIEGNDVGHSFYMVNFLGDLSFDEILSVEFRYTIQSEAGIDTGVFHSLDLGSIQYTSLGESDDSAGLVLEAVAAGLSFLASDAEVAYFLNGFVSVIVKTKHFPSGEVFGNAQLTSTRFSYGVVEVDLVPAGRGIMDMVIDGNAVTYYLNATDLSSPIYDILVRYDNNPELDDHLALPVMSEQDGVYGATAIATVLLVDKKIDALLGDSALVEIRTETSFANGDTAEVSGTTRLVYIESKTAVVAMNVNLNGDTDAWGEMLVNITANTVTYSFEMYGFFSSEESGGSEITAVSFHYAEDHGGSVETHTVHDLNLLTIAYFAVGFDSSENKFQMHANLTESQSFKADDSVIDVFISESVSVTVFTQSQPFGEIFGPVRLVV
jgi:hypothetical protein